MTIKMTVMPKGLEIDLINGETILEAAIRAGLHLPFGCRGGMCAACKGRILAGEIEQGVHSSRALTEAEREQGLALFCCATPKTDLIIECAEVQGAEEVQVKTLPCRVQAIDKISDDVAVLSLKLPTREPFSFLAGQYIDILMKDGKKRSFSIANPPHDHAYLQLHVRHVAGGEFSEYVFHEMKEREILRFTGPLGSFFLREDSDKPIIFIASGTGFAPVKSIVEHAFHIGIQRQMIFYWGARALADLYMLALPVAWQEKGNFTFIPVLSEPKPTDAWHGREGLVHEAVLQDFQDLSGWQVYACGAPVMVEAAHATFTARGLPSEAFFSDAFFLAKDLQKLT
jgi:CDP-4-dehydro-6-deoxyglucose reductase